jgi:hypothetical protein
MQQKQTTTVRIRHEQNSPAEGQQAAAADMPLEQCCCCGCSKQQRCLTNLTNISQPILSSQYISLLVCSYENIWQQVPPGSLSASDQHTQIREQQLEKKDSHTGKHTNTAYRLWCRASQQSFQQ